MARIGYARVSTKRQDHMAQVEALKAAACDRIYSEKASAKDLKGRPQFEKLKRSLLPGDVVVVAKLDRLARSSRDLHNILHDLGEIDCGLLSLGESWCDTTSNVGRLLIAIMSGVAEFERGIIRERCEEGIARARRKGTKFGRKSRLDAGQRSKIAERYAEGETIAELALDYDCGVGTIHRALNPTSQ
jgi:DNA invertase Pin-like site-specific DNA recombinase